MKRIIVSACLLLTFICGILALEQSQKRKAPRGGRSKQTVANRPPKIESFQSEFGTVVIPCPGWIPTAIPCTPNADYTIRLKTKALDLDGDQLLYKYSVTGGEISGQGTSVSWNYRGLKPSSYTAKVIVDDQRGGIASRSINVKVSECPVCDRFCPNITVSCPKDVERGQTIFFNVNVTGGGLDFSPTYNWSVSSGAIVSGQGTYTIEVDTNSLDKRQVTASVQVGGMPPECTSTASCITQIRKKDAGGK